MIKKYRKKPVEVEAMKFTGENYKEIRDWTGGTKDRTVALDSKNDGLRVKIRTLEGTMEAKEGDYIVKGVKGEFYPVKPEIFHETYEQVDN